MIETSATDQLDYYLTSLDELGEILIDAEQSGSVGKGILRLTLGTVMASKGAIFLYNQKKDELSILASQGLKKRKPFSPPKKLPDQSEKHRYDHIKLDKTPQWITGELKKCITESDMKILVPLFHKDHMLGVLCVGKKFMGEIFTEAELKILEIIANHLTKALYNYELIQDVEEKQTQLNLKLLELETLFDISVAISSVLDVDELGEEILWRSVGILNASKGMMLVPKENSPILEPNSSFNWEDMDALISKKLAVFKKIEDEKSGLIFTPEDKNSLQKKLGEYHIIIAPLRAKDNLLGYMLLCNKETRHGVEAFTQTDLDLLSALCNQGAVALDNARLFKDITKAKQFNESILGSIATGVITLDPLGEIDSINQAGLDILKMSMDEIIGNHYMYLFEKDDEILELIQMAELENTTHSEINMSFLTVSIEAVVNVSVAPRIDPDGNIQGLVIAIEDISDVSKVKNTFKRYVSKQVVDELLDDDAKLNLGGEEREVTILFSDIRGFTSMSENMNPESVVSTLNEYFSDMIDIVFKYNGTLDKIIGDELMIVYGAPISAEDDTQRAVTTAVEMQEQITRLNKKRKKRKDAPIMVGIGINRGVVVSGNIGSRDMMDYTVIGDTVNLGARLCSAAGPGEILVSPTVWKETKKQYSFEKLDPIKVKGKKNKVMVYRIENGK
ncbi:MAG TPA: PAS domain-containing protein [Candidatus Marinimicrobia bacterium]|nr:PAS domain-containing protein [Candidatus Neomarinimicrobiota bacterium]